MVFITGQSFFLNGIGSYQFWYFNLSPVVQLGSPSSFILIPNHIAEPLVIYFINSSLFASDLIVTRFAFSILHFSLAAFHVSLGFCIHFRHKFASDVDFLNSVGQVNCGVVRVAVDFVVDTVLLILSLYSGFQKDGQSRSQSRIVV